MRYVVLLLLFASLHGIIRMEAGPEGYWMRRLRKSGAFQDGAIYGIGGKLERLKNRSLYLGVEGHYGRGRLHGTTPRNEVTSSIMRVEEAEFRIGYTFCAQNRFCPWVAPYIGYQYVWLTNDFDPPTPIPATFRDSYEAVTLGFLSGLSFGRCWHIGLNFRYANMLNAKSRVTDDPEQGNRTILIENEPAYDVEIPIRYCRGCFEVSVIPFYRHIQFGGRESVPFDFIDTQFHIAGARGTIAVRY